MRAANESPMYKPERNVLKWWLPSRIGARSLSRAFFWSPPAVTKNKVKRLGDVPSAHRIEPCTYSLAPLVSRPKWWIRRRPTIGPKADRSENAIRNGHWIIPSPDDRAVILVSICIVRSSRKR